MPTDQLVSAEDLHAARAHLRHRGSTAVMHELEATEPDLLGYVLESHTALHHRLLEAGLSPRTALRLSRRMRFVLLVSLLALRSAHRRLWET